MYFTIFHRSHLTIKIETRLNAMSFSTCEMPIAVLECQSVKHRETQRAHDNCFTLSENRYLRLLQVRVRFHISFSKRF